MTFYSFPWPPAFGPPRNPDRLPIEFVRLPPSGAVNRGWCLRPTADAMLDGRSAPGTSYNTDDSHTREANAMTTAKPTLAAELLAEFLGTLVLILLGDGVVAM